LVMAMFTGVNSTLACRMKRGSGSEEAHPRRGSTRGGERGSEEVRGGAAGSRPRHERLGPTARRCHRLSRHFSSGTSSDVTAPMSVASRAHAKQKA
jgi:hypothetical protein